MAPVTLIILFSLATLIYGSNQRMCGEQLADTLSLVCNGAFNKRSGLEHVNGDETSSGVSKRSTDRGVVEECCFRDEGCTLATLQSYCAEPVFYDYSEEIGTTDQLFFSQVTEAPTVQQVQTEAVLTTTPSTSQLSARGQAIASRFLQIFRSGARSRGNSSNRRPYWFFLPGLQLGQRATRRPYTVNTR
ncbi:insulin-like growth factor II [Ylistrum balloti]|uniref:insulin-like growth factor II n=1 Tax=Ylistrum balloti TaxID=509963 RepID=UPI002905B483|nr:insulin-like growth factor II [Ylistrum balloti]